jgi:hypothetical protein
MANPVNTQPGSWLTARGPGGTSESIPEPVARRVWIASGGRCAFCNKNLLYDEITDQQVLIGQLAHIVGKSKADGSPRGDDALPETERNSGGNLMLLCYDQHHVIDDRSMWEVYDVETLRGLKRAHEDAMRRLTGLRDQQRSTVIRVVGKIGDVPVEMSRRTVAAALLERERFPDYIMLSAGNEFEVDLRDLPGDAEGSTLYWQNVDAHIADAVDRLRRAVAAGDVTHVSVLALARIPALIRLGAALGEGIQVDLYPTRRRGSEGFGWTPGVEVAEFALDQRRSSDAAKVAVLVSLSGTVDAARLPADVDASWTIYEITLTNMTSSVETICSQAALDNFTRCWRDLLATLERDHAGIGSVSVFPAVPVTAAIAMGRALIRGAHPTLAIYDLSAASERYEFTMDVSV